MVDAQLGTQKKWRICRTRGRRKGKGDTKGEAEVAVRALMEEIAPAAAVRFVWLTTLVLEAPPSFGSFRIPSAGDGERNSQVVCQMCSQGFDGIWCWPRHHCSGWSGPLAFCSLSSEFRFGMIVCIPGSM